MSSPAVYLAFLASTGLLRSILTDSGDPQDARSPLFARKSLRREAPPSVPSISEFRRQFCMSVEGAVESLEDQIGDILVQTRLEVGALNKWVGLIEALLVLYKNRTW